jgi:hypothetical protein
MNMSLAVTCLLLIDELLQLIKRVNRGTYWKRKEQRYTAMDRKKVLFCLFSLVLVLYVINILS